MIFNRRQLTGCTHAAAWGHAVSGELAGPAKMSDAAALDKLLGRRATEGEEWRQGAALVSSRASYEMVQKSAMCGVEILFCGFCCHHARALSLW